MLSSAVQTKLANTESEIEERDGVRGGEERCLEEGTDKS